MEQYRVNRVWVDDAHIWAETQNGWKANYPFSRWSHIFILRTCCKAHSHKAHYRIGNSLFYRLHNLQFFIVSELVSCQAH